MKNLDMMAQLADLKDTDYKNTLAISVLLELLVEKNILSRRDFAQKARQLEASTLAEILSARRGHYAGGK